jgi:hypothetical protein
MFFEDHDPPHVHAIYSGAKALVSISSGEVVCGTLSKKQAKLVKARMGAPWDETLSRRRTNPTSSGCRHSHGSPKAAQRVVTVLDAAIRSLAAFPQRALPCGADGNRTINLSQIRRAASERTIELSPRAFAATIQAS